MEGNKDESERCISIAEKFINDGHREKAVKYLYKAEKLYPSQRAKDLLDILSKLNGTTSMGGQQQAPPPSNGGAPPTPNGNVPNSDGPRKRTHSNSENRNPESEPTAEENVKRDYTDDQVTAVKKIKKCKDYYEVLSVKKDANENDLKRQYKKLALQFHPDKNKAPGATEAFKAIGNAFNTLSDKDKRRKYDMYVADQEQRVRTGQRRNSYYHYEYTRDFESDKTVEELFNMFFGRGFAASEEVFEQRGGTRWQYQHRHGEHHRENNYSAVLQMLPILVLIILSLTSSFFVADSAYSLQQSSKYPIMRQTQNLQVPYFVKESFMTEYKNSISRIERQVEDDYITGLRTSCFREMNYKETMLWRARQLRDEALMKKANNMKTPSCEALVKIRS